MSERVVEINLNLLSREGVFCGVGSRLVPLTESLKQDNAFRYQALWEGKGLVPWYHILKDVMVVLDRPCHTSHSLLGPGMMLELCVVV